MAQCVVSAIRIALHNLFRYAVAGSCFVKAVVLAALLLSSCRQQPEPLTHGAIVVQPGRGVPDVCELGMTLTQLRRLSPGVTVYTLGKRGYRSAAFIVIPSMGAVATIPSGNKRESISCIDFHTKVYEHGAMPGVEIRAPFKGWLGDRLTFSGGPVTSRDVESAFGVVSNSIPNFEDRARAAGDGQPYRWTTPWGTEQLVYIGTGLLFELQSNEVVRFSVGAAPD